MSGSPPACDRIQALYKDSVVTSQRKDEVEAMYKAAVAAERAAHGTQHPACQFETGQLGQHLFQFHLSLQLHSKSNYENEKRHN